MERTNLTQAESSRELLLKLLGVVNSEEEYRSLQEDLALVEAETAGFAFYAAMKGGAH